MGMPKTKARDLVYQAVRKGELTREPCEVCGDPKSQAHHEDYARPLEVRWLCQEHHKTAGVGINGTPDMVSFRCTQEDKDAFKAAADRAGLTMSEWARRAFDAECRRVAAGRAQGAGEEGLAERGVSAETATVTRVWAETPGFESQAAPRSASPSGTPGTCARTGIALGRCLCPRCKP